jgi:hydroxyacyl-ACP dehydratase HTD2-like protein with hotdog domain
MSLEQYLVDWHSQAQVRTERIAPEPVGALAALLDQRTPCQEHGDELPPLWHWLYFLDRVPHAELGVDGHPREGGFLPPIPHRRRMFAGGRLQVMHPISVGEEVTRRTALVDAVVKEGRSGELLFVTVRHELTVSGEPRVVEESDLVYRSDDSVPKAAEGTGADPTDPTPPVPSSEAPWQLRFTADPVSLFRFSALTYNAHRIHYDRPYAQQVEGFPELVVHGPLLALLLLELPRRFAPQRSVAAFGFRARRPVFAGQPVLVHGTGNGNGAWELAAGTGAGSGAMTGTVRLR